MRRLALPLLEVASLSLLASCAAMKEPELGLAAVEPHCGPPPVMAMAMAMAGEPDVTSSRATEVDDESTLSLEASQISQIIGVRKLVQRLRTLRESRADPRVAMEFLTVRQQILEGVMIAMLDVSRSAAEADCEEERANRLADTLAEARNHKLRHRTIFAIVGDAFAAILSGGLTLAAVETAAAASAIFGGSLAATFGLMALDPGGGHEFYHPRNMLKEVWEGVEQSALLPSSVWRFLVQRRGEEGSLRDMLLARWRQYGRLGERGSVTEQRRLRLLFSDGGLYEIDDLRARAAMLHLLESDINLMNQHLQLLVHQMLAIESE